MGTAAGDAIGLPYEGLTPRRGRKRFGHQELRHHFLFGKGMISDDTEHAVMVAQSLLEHPQDEKSFLRALGWKFRWWFLSLPAGLGMATLKSCLKLCLGFPPTRSGVYSAGNGPAMRAPLIGAYFHDDPERLESYVRASTRISHTDQRAFLGALAVARLTAWIVNHTRETAPDVEEISKLLLELPDGDELWSERITLLVETIRQGETVSQFAHKIGQNKGVTGFVHNTVPVAIYAWLRRYGDFRQTLESVVACGGDTDTVGAIAGALAGASRGPDKIPADWLAGIRDWPKSVGLLHRIAVALTESKKDGSPRKAIGYFWPAVLPRNLFFLGVVLLHGFRRLAPPY